MSPSVFATLSQVSSLMSGFFDFGLFVFLLVVAIRSVRPIDRILGTAIVVLAVARFVSITGSRSLAAAFRPIPFNDMNGVIPLVLSFFAFAITILNLLLWGSVILALSRLARRVTR